MLRRILSIALGTLVALSSQVVFAGGVNINPAELASPTFKAELQSVVKRVAARSLISQTEVSALRQYAQSAAAQARFSSIGKLALLSNVVSALDSYESQLANNQNPSFSAEITSALEFMVELKDNLVTTNVGEVTAYSNTNVYTSVDAYANVEENSSVSKAVGTVDTLSWDEIANELVVKGYSYGADEMEAFNETCSDSSCSVIVNNFEVVMNEAFKVPEVQDAQKNAIEGSLAILKDNTDMYAKMNTGFVASLFQGFAEKNYVVTTKNWNRLMGVKNIDPQARACVLQAQ